MPQFGQHFARVFSPPIPISLGKQKSTRFPAENSSGGVHIVIAVANVGDDSL